MLEGRVAIVTGASRGIGAAIARRFAAEGAAVAVSARSVEPAPGRLPGTITETVEGITAAGDTAVAVPADLARPEERERLVADAKRALVDRGGRLPLPPGRPANQWSRRAA